MAFNPLQREALLATPLVGAKVIQRLEEIGIDSFDTLRHADPKEICLKISHLLSTSCWQNSPQAQRAIENAIDTAKAAARNSAPKRCIS